MMLPAGYETSGIDTAQVVFTGFCIFFIGLVVYLRREDKREGYPLVDPTRAVPLDEFVPKPKVYSLLEGGFTQMPHREASSRVEGEPIYRFPNAPMVPLGDPLLAEIGPGAYPLRKDTPMMMGPDEVQVLPLRAAAGWDVAAGDADPRGMLVHDGRNEPVGVVRDLWVDRSVKILRYLEVELDAALTGPTPSRRALLPIYHADIRSRRRVVRVRSLIGRQFVHIPLLAVPDRITAREEDRINAFFAGALRYGRGREGGLPAYALPARLPRAGETVGAQP
jgi:photosynthetic reaction center H subunit